MYSLFVLLFKQAVGYLREIWLIVFLHVTLYGSCSDVTELRFIDYSNTTKSESRFIFIVKSKKFWN